VVNVCHYRPAGTTPDTPALALFQKQWQLYRKVRLDAANFPPSYSVDPYLPGQDAPNCVVGSAALGLVRPTRSLVVRASAL
jgi:hypothetical protein